MMIDAMGRASKQFSERSKGFGRKASKESNSTEFDELREFLDQAEIPTKEYYNRMKHEMHKLTKKLNKKESYLNKQRNTIQKLVHQLRLLKTEVQDPIEVFVKHTYR